MKKINTYKVRIELELDNYDEDGDRLEYARVIRSTLKDAVSLDWAGGLFGEFRARKVKIEMGRIHY